jgi:hypothetical protein
MDLSSKALRAVMGPDHRPCFDVFKVVGVYALFGIWEF